MSRSTGRRAGEVGLGVAREVDRRDRRPVVRAEDPAPAVDERERLERGRLAEPRQPDEHGGAARRERRDRLLDRRRQPDRLEHEVRPPSPAASRTAVAVAPGDAGSARTPCVAPSARASSSFAGLTSTATIRARAASTAPMTHDSPTPPSPITATLAPAGTSAVLSTAPDAGRDAAADERRHLGRDAVGHRHDRGHRDHLLRRHRADRQVGEHRRAVGAREPGRAVGLGVVQGRRAGAQPLAAAPALATAQAGRVPGERDEPADERRVDARPDRGRRRPPPRARARSAPGAPSPRRGRGGRSGRRPTRSSGRAPRRPAARRGAASRSGSADPPPR